MFEIVVVSVVIGFALILMLRRTTASIPVEEDYFAEVDPVAEKFEDWGLGEFEEVCRQLLAKWGLVVKDCSCRSEQEIEFVAHDPKPIVGGTFIIQGLLVHREEVIEASRVMALSDVVRAEKASKGVFITTGYFAADTAQRLEGAPLELINARKLRELLAAQDLLHLA